MDYFTVKEIAFKRGRSEFTTRRLCREGYFKIGERNIAIKEGRTWLIHKDDYEEWEKLRREGK